MRSILIIGILFFGFTMMAQESEDRPGDRRGDMSQEEMAIKMESQKIAFFTSRLELTPEEAQKFWPVYNEYSAKLKSLRMRDKENLQDKGERLSKAERYEKMTDKEAEENLQKMIIVKENQLNLQKSYVDKFKEVLPVKKVLKLFYLEKQFKDEMMKRIKQRMGGKGKSRENGEKQKRKNH